MSLQLRLFGGGNSNTGKEGSNLAGNDGSHAIDKSKVLATTAPGVITPMSPGNFGSIRTAPIVPEPRYFDKEEAQGLKKLAKEKTEGARHSKKAYKSLGEVEVADAVVHKSHRKYEGVVAGEELKKVRSNAGLAKKLHGLTPGYAKLGLGIDRAENKARTEIDAIKTRLTAGMN